MKSKLGWILFSIALVAVIILSSVLVSYEVKWKKGDELLNIYVDDVQSAYLYHYITSTEQPQKQEYELNAEQIQYIITEFYKSIFERDNSHYDEGSSGVVFKLKDGREVSFVVIGGKIIINDKQYKCHSYLTNYIVTYGFGE
ncbi:MAG: hypothetical protein K2K85_07585 [Clostridia bacterium]|nr:hypothetical protein [Clostridia bacterium]